MPFTTLGLGAKLSQALKEKGYVEPTPIQAKAIPVILSGRDVIGVAQTGTGKTAAFVLPLLERLAATADRRTMRVLVIAPTRELVAQIEENVRAYGRHLPLRYATIFGGVGEGPQIQALRRGVDLVVATPGRLIDLMEQRHVDFAALAGAGARRSRSHARHGLPAGDPQDRRGDAADPADAALLGDDVERDRARGEGSPEDADARGDRRALDAGRSGDAIRRRSLDWPARCRRSIHLLKDAALESVLVFSRTKHGADRIARKLERRRRPRRRRCIRIARRASASQALKRFKSGDVRVLIATDIAARGIDVDGISHVINFDFPPQPEDYVHRIGRTGRAQAIGDAISFVTHDDADSLQQARTIPGTRHHEKEARRLCRRGSGCDGGCGSAGRDGDRPARHDQQRRRQGRRGSSKGPRSGSFGPNRFGQRRGGPQGRRGRT